MNKVQDRAGRAEHRIIAAVLAPRFPLLGEGGFMVKRGRKGAGGSARVPSKSRSGHGGARGGAGRMAVLDEDQRFWIGAYYQNSWEKLIRGLARLRRRSDAIK